MDEVFEYCQVPYTGKKIFYSSWYEKKPSDNFDSIIAAFNKNPDKFKYTNPAIIFARFSFDSTQIPALYHFCSKDDFIKIIETKNFYIGNRRDMNDPFERTYAYKRMKHFIDQSHANLDWSPYKSRIEEFDDMGEESYVWSFTENGYTRSMSEYGAVAFRLNTSKIADSLNEYRLHFGKNKQQVYPIRVCYDSKIQDECLSYLANQIIEYIYSNKNTYKLTTLLGILNIYSLIFKNGERWKNEEEVRFIITRPRNVGKKVYDKLINGKMKLIAKIDSEELDRVIMYNSSETPNSIKSLKKILNHNGFKKVELIHNKF